MASQSMSISPNLEEDPWVDLVPGVLPHNTGGLTADIARIGLLPNGTAGGRATVMMEIVLPSGEKVVAETTLRLFRLATKALLASPLAEVEEMTEWT